MIANCLIRRDGKLFVEKLNETSCNFSMVSIVKNLTILVYIYCGIINGCPRKLNKYLGSRVESEVADLFLFLHIRMT